MLTFMYDYMIIRFRYVYSHIRMNTV